MPFSHIFNGQAASTGIDTINEMMDALNAVTAAGTALMQSADAVAAAAVLGSSGGNGSADNGLAALFGTGGELVSTYELNTYSADRAAIIALSATGFASLALQITSSAAALRCIYGDETNVFGAALQFPTLGGNRTWDLPDASGTLMLTSAIGSTVQAYSANLATLAGKSLSGTGNLACVTSPTFVTPILGTPTSGTLTNCSGLPAAGVTGLGTMATQAASAVAITGGTATGLTNLGVSMANNTAMTGFALGTISDTTSRPLSISQTLNNAGLTATLLKVSATVTSALAASKLIDLCAGASGTTSIFSVDTSGNVLIGGSSTGDTTFTFPRTTSGATYVPTLKTTFSANTFQLGANGSDLINFNIGNSNLTFNTSGGLATFSGGITLSDAKNLAFGTTTGTKLGTATTQKLGFWNVTPVVQQVLATGTSKTVDDVITLLQTIGLCKQS